jgi:FkbM family methyltransferase
MRRVQSRTTSLRRIVRLGASRVGAERPLMRAYAAVTGALDSPAVRRNRRDDARVRLLAAGVLTADSNCVDIGTNEGQLLEVFVELAPQGCHIAYEPVPTLRDSLARRFPTVEVRGAAVSDRCGESTFIVNKQLPSRSSLRSVGYAAAGTETIRVPVEALDVSLPVGYVPDLVKVDVEGAEYLVLSGARETLRRHRPVVLFEHQRSTARHYRTGPEQMFGLLVDELDMRIFDLDGAGPYSLAALQRAYETASRLNFFAHPASR